MSLYNMVCGLTGATFHILPMLGKHPEEYPRFRDCFTGNPEHPEYDNHIIIYTRTGGGNREGYIEENQDMREMEGFIADYDNCFDSTFACWVFKVPKRWKTDYDILMAKDFKYVSKEYQRELIRIFPKLEEKLKKQFAEQATL